jgi:multisubunit Na+/H+ antiporter MnhB subunit
MNFSLNNKLDLAIVISLVILVLTGAFLRFFKYFFTPLALEKATLILIPETLISAILIAIKFWRK